MSKTKSLPTHSTKIWACKCYVFVMRSANVNLTQLDQNDLPKILLKAPHGCRESSCSYQYNSLNFDSKKSSVITVKDHVKAILHSMASASFDHQSLVTVDSCFGAQVTYLCENKGDIYSLIFAQYSAGMIVKFVIIYRYII